MRALAGCETGTAIPQFPVFSAASKNLKQTRLTTKMNSFSAYALSWNQPEPSICGADQKERSSGDENKLKLTLKEIVRK